METHDATLEVFLSTQRHLGRPPRFLRTVARVWPRLARRFKRSGLPALRNYLAALARLPPKALPHARDVFRLGKLLASDFGRPVWDHFFSHLATSPHSLSPLLTTLDDLVRARAAARASHAKVQFADIALPLDHVIRDIFPLAPSVVATGSSTFVRRDNLTAATNGRTIYMPESIDLLPSEIDNILAYVRLASHEAAHILAESFVSFPYTGVRAYDRLPVLGPLLRRRELRHLRATRREKRRSWTWLTHRKRPASEHMTLHVFAAFHMRDPALFLWLTNLIEDRRIERWLRDEYPRLTPLHDYLDAIERSRSPHPATLGADENARRVIAQLIQGESATYTIPNSRRELIRGFEREILPRLAEPLPSMEHSLAIAVHAHDLMLSLLPRLGKGESHLPKNKVDREFVHGRNDFGPSRESEHDWGRSIRRVIFSETDDVSENRPHLTYPEVTWPSDQPTPDRVHLYEEDDVMGSADIPANDFARGAQYQRRSFEGDELDLDRAYDLIVARRGHGRAADERIFLTRAGGENTHNDRRRLVTFMVDLSSSMAPQGMKDAHVPLVRLRHILRTLIPTLEHSGVHTQVLGGSDIGRRLVYLRTLKPIVAHPGWDASLDSQFMPGFRHGAFVRHLSRILPDRGAGFEHHIVLCTDTASHYVNFGLERILRAGIQDCPVKCAKHKQRCAFDGSDTSGILQGLGLFADTLEEMTDLRHAIGETSIPVHGLLFGHHYRDETLNRAFGPSGWTRVSLHGETGPSAKAMASLLLDRPWAPGPPE